MLEEIEKDYANPKLAKECVFVGLELERLTFSNPHIDVARRPTKSEPDRLPGSATA
jgi:hypothetical protein